MRYHFLGTEVDEQNVEWCFLLDEQTGDTLKSRVRMIGAQEGRVSIKIPVVQVDPAIDRSNLVDLRDPRFNGVKAPPAGSTISTENTPARDVNGEQETPEERKARLAARKVPPAFLGNTASMHLDPAKHEGRTDVTKTM